MRLTIAGFHGHIAGSYEDEEGKLVVDLTVASDNVFFFFPPDTPAGETASTLQQRNKLVSDTYRWVFDPKASLSHIRICDVCAHQCYSHRRTQESNQRVSLASTASSQG